MSRTVKILRVVKDGKSLEGTARELAGMIGMDQATISCAVKRGYTCRGYRVYDDGKSKEIEVAKRPRRIYRITSIKTGETLENGAQELGDFLGKTPNTIVCAASDEKLVAMEWKVERLGMTMEQPKADYSMLEKIALANLDHDYVRALYCAYTSGRNPWWTIEHISQDTNVPADVIRKIVEEEE